LTPSTSEDDIGISIPEGVREWLHRAPITGDAWHDADILFEAAENWRAAGCPRTAQGLVDSFDFGAGSALAWLDFMGYGQGPHWEEKWPEYREGLHTMSIRLKHTGISYDAVIVPNGTEPALSVIGNGKITGTKGQVAGEMALLAAEDMLYGLCSQSVGPLQFELVKALDRAGADFRAPLLRQERPGPMDEKRHSGLVAAFKALSYICNEILRDGLGLEPVACGGLSERFARVEALRDPDKDAVDGLVSLISLIPEGMLPLRSDGIVLCFDGKTQDIDLRVHKGPTWFEPLFRTVNVCPEDPSGLINALARALDFACGLYSASESFDYPYDYFMTDLYGKPPDLEKGTLKWYQARQEVFVRMYEHYLHRKVPGIGDICTGFGPDRRVSEAEDVILHEDVDFVSTLPNMHSKIADGSSQLSIYIKDERTGEDVLFDGREWTLSVCLVHGDAHYALLMPTAGNDSDPVALEQLEWSIFEYHHVIRTDKPFVMEMLLAKHSMICDGEGSHDG